MSVREHDDPELFARIQEQNLLRQYDLLTNCIEVGLAKGIEAFDKYTLWRLNWIHPFVEGNGRTARAACYYFKVDELAAYLESLLQDQLTEA
ncbi:MAG: Fic family protein [Nannocystaceae bacterium]